MLDSTMIKVGYLVSYDYEYIKYSLPTVYDYADVVYLAIDKDGLTWSGEKFEIPNHFFEWIEEFDTQKKIHIYRDSFYVSEMSSSECDTRERNMLAMAMGEGGWHIQVDSDEYFVDFAGVVDYLKKMNTNKPVTIIGEFITIFKNNGDEYLYIDNGEKVPAITNNPSYVYTRSTVKENKKIKLRYKIVHNSWGRSEEELAFKLSNWSHSLDFNTQSYFNLWKAVDKYTYRYLYNFHPIHPKMWQELKYIEADSIPTLLNKMKQIEAEKQKSRKGFFGFFRKK